MSWTFHTDMGDMIEADWEGSRGGALARAQQLANNRAARSGKHYGSAVEFMGKGEHETEDGGMVEPESWVLSNPDARCGECREPLKAHAATCSRRG